MLRVQTRDSEHLQSDSPRSRNGTRARHGARPQTITMPWQSSFPTTNQTQPLQIRRRRTDSSREPSRPQLEDESKANSRPAPPRHGLDGGAACRQRKELIEAAAAAGGKKRFPVGRDKIRVPGYSGDGMLIHWNAQPVFLQGKKRFKHRRGPLIDPHHP